MAVSGRRPADQGGTPALWTGWKLAHGTEAEASLEGRTRRTPWGFRRARTAPCVGSAAGDVEAIVRGHEGFGMEIDGGEGGFDDAVIVGCEVGFVVADSDGVEGI